jgi:hypothetical protein
MVLSVLRFTASDYPLGTFRLFFITIELYKKTQCIWLVNNQLRADLIHWHIYWMIILSLRQPDNYKLLNLKYKLSVKKITTQWCPIQKQELFTLREHMGSTLVFCWAVLLIFLCRILPVFLRFSLAFIWHIYNHQNEQLILKKNLHIFASTQNITYFV